MVFVDTNYFIRFLLNDIPFQAAKARNLFKKASEGKIKLYTSTIVFFEIYWLFLKYYEKPKNETVETLKAILFMNFLLIEEREVLQSSLDIYLITSLELEDCYNIAYSNANNIKDFATFDKKLVNYLKK